MDVTKFPRWAVDAIAVVGIGSCTFLFSTARAELEKVKAVAYQAKSTSELNAASITDIKETVNEIKTDNKTYRSEYRTDQKELDNKMAELLKAVKS